MRTAFIQNLLVQARSHADIFLVVGDLGYSVVEPFAQEFPDRFLNAGVAEQNMTGVAAGLASEGYHVFTYSIANFPTLRCLEQIRNDVCNHQLPVTIVAVGAGLAYGNLGYSHHAIEDIGTLRLLPNMTVLSPADPGETHNCVQWLVDNPCPSYFRIGKAGEPELHNVRISPRRPVLIRHGTSAFALASTGSILQETLATADALKATGLDISVFSLPWLHPLDPTDLIDLAEFKCVFAVEEQCAIGGLSDILKTNLPPAVTVIPFGVKVAVAGMVGSQSFLRAKSGLDTASLVRQIPDVLRVHHMFGVR